MEYVIEDIPVEEKVAESYDCLEEFYNSMPNRRWGVHYERLITRALFRDIDGYVEKHHVIPRCMGGTDVFDNIVKLTASEHYIAHLLLAKIYDNNPSLIFAAHMMCRVCENNKGGNKRFKWVREKVAKELSERYTGMVMLESTKNKIGAANKGKPKPKRTKDHIENLKSACTGRVVSEETRKKLSEAGKGRIVSAETRAKIGAANKITATGHKCSDATKALKREITLANQNCLDGLKKAQEYNKGKKRPPEVIAKMLETRKDYRHSEETKAKISQTSKNRVVSEETKAKMRATWEKKRAAKLAEQESLFSEDTDIKWCENA